MVGVPAERYIFDARFSGIVELAQSLEENSQLSEPLSTGGSPLSRKKAELSMAMKSIFGRERGEEEREKLSLSVAEILSPLRRDVSDEATRLRAFYLWRALMTVPFFNRTSFPYLIANILELGEEVIDPRKDFPQREMDQRTRQRLQDIAQGVLATARESSNHKEFEILGSTLTDFSRELADYANSQLLQKS